MKTILLTTTALVAFAGAAAADGHSSVSFSASASAEYNSDSGLKTVADLDATMSADLDNGLNVSTKMSFDTDNYAQIAEGTVSGSLTLSTDTASLTFGNDITSASYSAVSDTIGFGDGEDDIQGVIGSYSMGDTTVFVSLPFAAGQTDVDSDNIELGVTAAVGDMTFGFATADSDFIGKVSGTAGGLSYTAAAGSVADANRWDVKVSYPTGPVTVAYTVDDTEAWEVSAEYAEGAIAASISYNDLESYDVEASYDAGNGLVVSAGMLNSADDTYFGADYSLGGGASAYASYVNDTGAQNADNEIGANDYARGTTVGVSFTF